MQISFSERLKSVRNDLKLSLHSPMVSLKKKSASLIIKYFIKVTCAFKVSVKESELPTEKNSSRASIFATKASYISN